MTANADLEQRLRERTIERDYHLRVAEQLSDRVRELETQVEQLKAVIVSDTHVLLSRRPVAFRVPYISTYILFNDEHEANQAANKISSFVQGLYARNGQPKT